MILICGDIHSPIDINKLNSKNFPEQKEFDESVVLINLGDWGGLWYEKNDRKYRSDTYWINWLGEKKYTFAFLDGNHENHNMIAKLNTEEKWNGEVGIVKTKTKDLYHLKRGEIYTINDKKILIIGGAKSNDIESRKENKDWWRGELLSLEDKTKIINNLEKHDWKVDYVLTHTAPKSILSQICGKISSGPYDSSKEQERLLNKISDPTTKFLDLIREKLDFKEWHFGHIHIETKIREDYSVFDDNFEEMERRHKTRFFQSHYNSSPHILIK